VHCIHNIFSLFFSNVRVGLGLGLEALSLGLGLGLEAMSLGLGLRLGLQAMSLVLVWVLNH